MSWTPFDELGNSPIIDLSLDGSKASREGKIPWNQLNDFIEYIFPTDEGGGRQFPGLQLFARSMHIENFVGEQGRITSPAYDSLDYEDTNVFEWAKVRIEYESPRYDSGNSGGDPQPLLSHQWTAESQAITLSVDDSVRGQKFYLKWPDGKECGQEASKYIGLIGHQMTWPQVQSPPFSVIRDRIGCVNNAVMNFSTGDIAAETLLFLGADLKRDIIGVGSTVQTLGWEIVYKFSERRVNVESGTAGGWNHFLRAEKDQPVSWQRATLLGSSEPLFALKSFAELFIEGF